MAQDKLIKVPSKSERIEQHLDKMRELFHPNVKDGMYTPEEKKQMALERTKLLLDQERSKKEKPMADIMTGSEYADFNPEEVDELLAKSTNLNDPIMEDTKQFEPRKVKPMQEESFPKFQYSIFMDAQKNAQMVIRANTFEEFKQAKKDVDDLLLFVHPATANVQAQPLVQAPQQAVVAPSVTVCPKCGSEMWDNRGKKTNPKAPDFKCKNQDCGHAIWPAKK